MARFFVNRPIVAIVISIVTVLLGTVAMGGLPIAQYPEIVPPMVQVTTTFVGASATVKGATSGVPPANVRATRRSFHTHRNWKMPKAANAGVNSGRST